MNRTPIVLDPEQLPEAFHRLLEGSRVFASSCSPAAKVY